MKNQYADFNYLNVLNTFAFKHIPRISPPLKSACI